MHFSSPYHCAYLRIAIKGKLGVVALANAAHVYRSIGVDCRRSHTAELATNCEITEQTRRIRARRHSITHVDGVHMRTIVHFLLTQ